MTHSSALMSAKANPSTESVDRETSSLTTESPLMVCETMIDQSQLPAPIEHIARLFDGRRSVAQVLQRARISEVRGQAVIKKLRTLGILMPTRRVVRKTDGFSEIEEAFFNSEVEPIDECDLPFETWRDRIGRAVRSLVRD